MRIGPADEEVLTVADLHEIASEMLVGVAEGDQLDRHSAALISFGLAASVTSLNTAAIDASLDEAMAAGASLAQLQETAALVSGLGVHTLMASSRMLLERAHRKGALPAGALDDHQQKLWNRYVGTDPFWNGFEAELPGFLEAMLRLSTDQFVAFFDYCAVPWKSGTVRARCKELIAMACDATPAHRFLPGFRLHLRNAVALGVNRRAVLDALELAADAPAHRGTC